MPPKKGTKKDPAAAAPKPARKKSASPAKEKKSSASKSASSAGAKMHSQKTSGRGNGIGLAVFVILVAIIIVVGGYVYQERQTDSIASHVSKLQGEFESEIHGLQEDLQKTKEELQKQKELQEEKKRSTVYVDEAYGFSFEHGPLYEVSEQGEHITEDDAVLSSVYVRRLGDEVKYKNSLEGYPVISAMIFENAEGLSLEEWAAEYVKYTNFDDETQYEAVEYGNTYGIAYSWIGLGGADGVLLQYTDTTVLALSAQYFEEADSIRNDFRRMLSSLAL